MTSSLIRTIVWTTATIGVVAIPILVAILRILRGGDSSDGAFNYDVLNYTIFKYDDFKRLVSDWQSIKDSKKKVVLIYGVHDNIKDNAIRAIRERVLELAPETHNMEDFLILTVVDGAVLNVKEIKFHIIKFDKLEDCLYERFSKSPLFTEGAMVIGKFN